MVKFRPSKKALGKAAEGPGADALAAVRASLTAAVGDFGHRCIYLFFIGFLVKESEGPEADALTALRSSLAAAVGFLKEH